MAEREIMTLDEVAQYLRVHPSTIYRMLKHHQIPAFRMGADWRFVREAVDKWFMKKIQTDGELGVQPHVGGHPRSSARKRSLS